MSSKGGGISKGKGVGMLATEVPTRRATYMNLMVLPKVELAAVPRAVLGCIQIPTDQTLDSEGPQLVDRLPGVVMLMQKMEFDSDLIQADTYLRAERNVGRAAATFLPSKHISVMGLSCTSMSFTLGPDAVDWQLCQGNVNVKTTDMARAQIAAVKALGAKKVALLTPYMEELSVANMRMLEREGIEVVKRATMGLDKDELTARVTPECISEWVEAVVCPDADAVVIGCSAFRACSPGFIDALEKKIKKPVITSTQAFMWSMVRAAGIEDQISDYGTLFKNH